MSNMLSIDLRSGGRIDIYDTWTRVTLPSGHAVHAIPLPEQQFETAERLGYGSDVVAMTRDHDPLHALLADWLGLRQSYSLTYATGELAHAGAATLEEEVVMALQRFIRALGLGVAEIARRNGYEVSEA
jgi:hypothetical protein